MKQLSMFLSIAFLVMLAVAETASAQPTSYFDFVMYSGGGLTISGGYETEIGGHTEITGNIGSTEDLFMQGNPLPGYPAQLNGSAYAGGNLTFGQDLTVGSSSGPLYEVVANGAANIGGGANIYGNLYADDVTLGQNTGIRQVSGVGGNVEYTTSYSDTISSVVEGNTTSPSSKTFTPINMPEATVFSAGGVDQQVNASSDYLTLAPGTYGALSTSQQNQTVNLSSSGNYFFDSITTQGGFTLEVDLTTGAPVKIYAVGNVDFAQHNTLMVKGAGTGGSYVPIDQAQSLAGLIYLETYGFFDMGGATTSDHNIWGGTVYASSRSESADVTIGQYMDWYGALYAYDTIDVADHGLYTHVPVVPEPVSSTLFIVGGATLGFRRFRKKLKK